MTARLSAFGPGSVCTWRSANSVSTMVAGAALTFIARRRGEGTPRPGYINRVVEAAREWRLPQRYVDTLRRWSPSSWRGARAKDIGEMG